MIAEPVIAEASIDLSGLEAPQRAGVRGDALTTIAIGGPISSLIEPQTVAQAAQTIEILRASATKTSDVPWRILGAGSNLLIPDEGVRRPVIRLGRPFTNFCLLESGKVSSSDLDKLLLTEAKLVAGKEGDEIFVLAFGAAPLMGLSRKLCQEGIAGLEFAAGIPASAGGAVRMNAGAHGHCMAEVIKTVFALDIDGKLKTYQANELDFGYRSVNLPPDSLVVATLLSLRQSDRKKVMDQRSSALEYRRKTQPLHLPSSGSVFKNPSPEELLSANINTQEFTAAAQFLESVGLKGCRHGGVEYSQLHSNWLVKILPTASARDVMSLIELGQEKVQSQYSIRLKPELVSWI